MVLRLCAVLSALAAVGFAVLAMSEASVTPSLTRALADTLPSELRPDLAGALVQGFTDLHGSIVASEAAAAFGFGLATILGATLLRSPGSAAATAE